MILIRRDPSPKKDEWPDDHRQEEFEIEQEVEDISPEASKIRVNFNRFGRGAERRSDFAVEMDWIDVRGIVQEFIEMEHPEALYLCRIVRLAKEIADDAPAEEFWESIRDL